MSFSAPFLISNMANMMSFVVEFLFHLLWLAIVEGLTVEFLISEIQMVRNKANEHSDDEPESPKTENFPEYVSLTRSTVSR